MKCICILLCCLFSVKSAVLRNETYRLDVVHYNDFHARFEETSVIDPICKSNDAKCIGGFARLFYEIKHILAKRPGALLLNAGDDFQGTYWYTLMKYKVASKFINMLPNDAHAIGNHEFDDGVSGLVPYLKALRDPVLAANLDISMEPSLEGLFLPHVVLEKKGRKIGIIGVTTVDTKVLSNPGKVKFLDPLPIVQREAKLLTDQGVDIIIVLSHCGLYVDKEMGRTVGENIDIIVGGHTHSLLWNGTSPSNEFVSGSYPEFKEAVNKPGHKVLVITASAFSKYLGYIGADFDDEGELVSFEAEPVFLNRSIPEDAEIKALLKPYVDQLHDAVNGVVGTTSDSMSFEACGDGECPLGDLIADSFLAAGKKNTPTNLTAFAYFHKIMIRTDVSKGDITIGDVINVQPFGNKLWSYKILGKYLKETLELTMRQNAVRYMPQVAGLKLTINSKKNKVVSALVKEDDGWKPFLDDQEYQIVTQKYTKDLCQPLKINAIEIGEVGTDWELVADHIRQSTPITPSVDGRLTVQS